MRWTLFVILLVLVYLAQTALLPQFGIRWLDLFLVTALVCGLVAPTPDARLAAWIVGFVQDLATDGPLGLHALALGLAVLALTFVREQVNLQLWWVRWLMAFIVAYPAEILVRLVAGTGHGFVASQVLGWPLTTAFVGSFLASFLLALPSAFRPRRRRRSAVARW